MELGLGIASVAAILAWSRVGFSFGFTDPKILLIGAGVMIAWYFKTGRDAPPRLKKAVVLYSICFLASLVFTRDLSISLFGVKGIFSGSLLTAAMCVSGVVLASKVEKPDVLKKVILCAGAFAAVHGLAQHFGADPFRIGPLPENGAVGMIGSRIDFGAMMVAMFTVSHNPLYLLGLWSSHSRGAWLGAAVAIIPIKYRVIGFILASAATMSLTFYSKAPKDILRVEVWKVAVHSATVQGTGPATFLYTFAENRSKTVTDLAPHYLQAHAHNQILEAVSTRGLLGLLGLLSFLVAPSMTGLWTIGMFNPISFEVVFVACVLVGLRRQEE